MTFLSCVCPEVHIKKLLFLLLVVLCIIKLLVEFEKQASFEEKKWVKQIASNIAKLIQKMKKCNIRLFFKVN